MQMRPDNANKCSITTPLTRSFSSSLSVSVSLSNSMEQKQHDDDLHQTPATTDDFDSACSTPFVSAPSSPGRTPSGFFYSAPASPIHFMLSSSASYSTSKPTENNHNTSFEFEFTAKEASVGTPPTGTMTSADELFLNGQIRPMNLLSPLHEIDSEEERGRYRSKSLRRRARSMSPMRTSCDDHFRWLEEDNEITEHKPKIKMDDQAIANSTKTNHDHMNTETTSSGVSSRSSSVGRSSNRWVFLKEFLYRSKSEGRNSTSSNNNNNNKFWTSLSFSPNHEKKIARTKNDKEDVRTTAVKKKAVNGVEMRRVGRSAHERHYPMNRAQAEEMRKKTYLPYKQGLLGCLGFSSKGYGAMNGFARALNPVSSR